MPTAERPAARRRSASTRSRTTSRIRRISARFPGASPTGSPTAASSSTASNITLDRKPGEKHTLHGGPNGFGKRIWTLGAYDASSVSLTLESPDGDAGFPGALDGDLRLSHARARDAQGRTLGDDRQADGRQPHPARLFQSRRLAGHPRPRGDARSPTSTRRPTPNSSRPAKSARSPGRPTTSARRARCAIASGTTYDTNFVAARALGRRRARADRAACARRATD